jgi:hypothetical protein
MMMKIIMVLMVMIRTMDSGILSFWREYLWVNESSLCPGIGSGCRLEGG